MEDVEARRPVQSGDADRDARRAVTLGVCRCHLQGGGSGQASGCFTVTSLPPPFHRTCTVLISRHSRLLAA
jgi:hypothetical protein